MSDNFLKIKNGIGLKPKNLATIVNPAAGDVACDESDNKIKFYDVSTSTWTEMGSGGGAVDSVNGQTGTVVLTKSDVGLSNVDNTSDANKPISTATQTALDNIKQDLDTIFQLTADENLNTWSYTTTAGSATFSKLTGTNALQGDASYSLYLDAGGSFSSSVTLTSPEFTLDPVFRTSINKECILDLSYTYNNAVTNVTINLQGYSGGGWSDIATITPIKSTNPIVRYNQLKFTLNSAVEKVRINIRSANLAVFTNFTLNFDSVRLYAINSDVYWGNIKGSLTNQTDLNNELTAIKQTYKDTLDTVYSIYDPNSIAGWSAGTSTLSTESGSNIQGSRSFVISSSSTTLNTVSGPAFTIDPVFRGKTVSLKFPNFMAATAVGRVYLYDNTNSIEISNSSITLSNAGTVGSPYTVFNIPDNCLSMRLRVEITAILGTATIKFNAVEITTDVAKVVDIANITAWSTPTTITIGATTTAPTKGTTSEDSVRWRRVGEDYEVQYRFRQTTGGTAGSGEYIFSLPSGLEIDQTNLSLLESVSSCIGTVELYAESTVAYSPETIAFTYSGSTTSFKIRYVDNLTTSGIMSNSGYSLSRPLGFTINLKFKGKGLTASTPMLVTTADQITSDTIDFSYKSSSAVAGLSALANAPVGTYITFTYAANSNTRTQTTARPTQSDLNMNTNGIQMFTRAYNAASTPTQPACVAIQIGKGFKGYQLGLYKSVGKVTSGSLDYYFINSTVVEGVAYKSYDSSTGILLLDTGFVNLSTNTTNRFSFSDATTQNNGYVTFAASKSPALVGIQQPQVAYLKDVKASGTAGGTFTSGAWQTRTLNTLEGSSFVTLSANQFTLPAGSYEIEASAPAFQVNNHKAVLYDLTNSTDKLIGSTEFSQITSDATTNRSLIVGTINLSSSATFEIRHRSSQTTATTGFGIASSFGVSEVYTVVKIKKIG